MGIVKRDSLKLTVISYIGAALGYANKILLFPNFLHPAQVGLANVLISIAVIYAQMSALGVHSITLRFFPFFNDKARKHNGYLFWSTFLVLIGFLITTLIFLVFKPVIGDYFSKKSPMLMQYYYYIIPLGLATVLFYHFDAYLRSLLKTVVPSFFNEVVTRLLITVSISLFAFHLVDFHQFVIVYVAVNCTIVVLMIAYMIYIKQFFIKPVYSRAVKRLMKFILLYGGFTILSGFGNAIISTIDSLMVAAKLGLKDAGIYTTVFFISTVMLLPYRSILKIGGPLIARFWKEKDMQGMSELYNKVTMINMIFGGLLFVGLWVNMDNIFRFMPHAYAAGKYVFLFIALGRYVDMSSGLNGVIMMTSKKYKYDLLFTGVLLVSTIILNIVLIPVWGMIGAAVAACATIMLFNIMRILFVLYNYKIQPFAWKNLWILFIGAGAIIVSFFIPFLKNVYVDILIRSIIVTIVFITPIVLLRLSKDVNEMVYGILKLDLLKSKAKK